MNIKLRYWREIEVKIYQFSALQSIYCVLIPEDGVGEALKSLLMPVKSSLNYIVIFQSTQIAFLLAHGTISCLLSNKCRFITALELVFH